MTRSPRSVFTVYGAGLLQGLAFVLIPALGSLLEASPYRLSHSAYGMLFLPETAGAIGSALAAGPLNARMGDHGVFRLGLGCNVLAGALLAGSAPFAGQALAYAMLLAESAFLGLGFGLTLAAINHFAADLFPRNETAAITILNGVIGGSTAVSPLVLHAFEVAGAWWLWPALVAGGFALVLGSSARIGEAQRRAASLRGQARFPLAMFGLAVLLYAICEGTFGSWADIYVTVTQGLPSRYGAWALTAFWGGMTAFRVGLSLLPKRWTSPVALYLAAPLAMAACFVALFFAGGAWALVGTFAAAGAACGIYYPYSMSFALQVYDQAQTRVAGLLVAALMAGEGIGSYAVGPLQDWVGLERIYAFSALWAVPLVALAFYLGRYAAGHRGAPHGLHGQLTGDPR
jgi:fucose permease